ncbi:MAG: UvrD-helicase domain-containing protein [Myxococcales bacterium]|nr:UvrD-helicase domain-containing protein [Myxococcales bacterium]
MLDLHSLNPAQREAVLTTDGPLLVLAGAGSGKTRVITYRIARLLALGVPAERILALSFTNKAAEEMRERVEKLIGARAKGCVLSTFHALGVRFLREEAEAVGRTAGFTILDEGDQRDAVRLGLVKLGYDPQQYDPKVVHGRISADKGLLRAPDPAEHPVASRIFPLYERRLRVLNAVDFDDLIVLPVRALEAEGPQGDAVRGRWRERFHYIMVDEYQDTNGAQLRMVQALAGRGNVCVVGDDDQSIYAWRGAVAGNILHFDRSFPGARMVALTQNYRSTNHVLRAANAVIRNNVERHEKTLWSENGDGPLLRYALADNDEEEAHWIATDMLGARHRLGLKWSDFAVLYRTNAQSRVVEDAIRNAGIPYRLVGGTRFYDRKEVRDVVAYLRVIANPFDETAWRRIVNYPSRGVGDVSLERLADYAAGTGLPFFRVLQRPEIQGLSPKVQETVRGLEAKIADLRARFAAEPLGEVCRSLIKMFGFADELVRVHKDVRQVRRRMDDLEEVASALASFHQRNPGAGLTEYLAKLALDTRPEEDGDAEADQASLMTLHASKGLEFTAVYLAGVEEGLMPHQRVLEGEGELDEERRLAYVGITRAKVHLTLTGAKMRLKFGRIHRKRPSRFLEEIPDELFLGGRTGKLPEKPPEERERQNLNAFAAMRAAVAGKDESPW